MCTGRSVSVAQFPTHQSVDDAGIQVAQLSGKTWNSQCVGLHSSDAIKLFLI